MRYAPSGRLASTVLGFVGTDENGLDGLEYAFDNYLRGTPGKTRVEADQFGRAIPFGDSTVVERAVPGRTLVLTLDSYMQFEAERLIDAAMKTWHAKSATGDRDGRALGRDPRDGQRARLRPESLRRVVAGRVAQPRGRRCLRARLDVQADHRRGGAREREGHDAVALSGARSARRRRPHDSQRRGRLHGRHRRARNRSKTSSRTRTTSARPKSACAIGAPTLYAHDRGVRLRRLHAHRIAAARIRASCRRSPIGAAARSPRSRSATASRRRRSRSRARTRRSPTAACCCARGSCTRSRTPNGKVDLHVRARGRAPRDLRGDGREAAPDLARGGGVRNGQSERARLRATRRPAKPARRKSSKTAATNPASTSASFIGYVPAEAPRYVIFVKIERPRGAYYGGVVAAPIFADARARRDAA